MNDTWTAVRRNRSDTLNRADFADMELVKADRVYCTAGNRTMQEARTASGRTETKPLSMQKLLRLGLVHPLSAGDRVRLNEDGNSALKAWRDNRANTNPATEGPEAP